MLNFDIITERLDASLKLLNNNNACGIDSIINEHIKYTYHILKNIYLNLCNVILHTGIISDDWSVGIINPVYKNKGDEWDASNYRPITLFSCLSKFFTMILYERLLKYVEYNDISSCDQAGFRNI